MLRYSVRRVLGFFILLGLITWYHQGHGTILDYVIATLAVLAFWFLHSIQFSISNVRMLIFITCLFAVPLFFADNIPFFSWHEGVSGPWTAESFNPSQVGTISLSHEIAAQIYFDHEPKGEERYTKTGVLVNTSDGLRYQTTKVPLDDGLMPEAKAWAERNLKGHTLVDKEAAIQRYLQKDFQYTLSPGMLAQAHPLDEFLFERKMGYCQHYAGATATLLKLSGTPARVVVGFSGGFWNPILNTLTYEMADSHAWVEAYDSESKNWILVDPTYWVLQFAPAAGAADMGLILKSLAVLILCLTLLFFILARGRDPVLQLFARVEKFERRQRLSALGLTLRERLSRMAVAQPKRAKQIAEMIRVYEKAFFKGEPTRETLALLKISLSKWKEWR